MSGSSTMTRSSCCCRLTLRPRTSPHTEKVQVPCTGVITAHFPHTLTSMLASTRSMLRMQDGTPRVARTHTRPPVLPIRSEYCGQLTNNSSSGHNTQYLDQSEESIAAS